MSTSDIAVTFILLAVSLVVVIAMLVICRVLSMWHASINHKARGEKEMLTKDMPNSGYTQGNDSDLRLDPKASLGLSGAGPQQPQQATQYASMADNGACFPEVQLPAEPPVDMTANDDEEEELLEAPQVAEENPATPKLHRAMSCDSVASDSSVLDWTPDVPKIGQLEYGLEYDGEAHELVVSIIQARDLEANQVTGTLDSYVKCWLTPHKESKVQTKVQKDTINPIYKERFTFKVLPDDVEKKTLQFQVFSSDKYARHKLLGETELQIGDIELRQPIRIWMNLKDMDEKPTDMGNIMFSLSYLPTAERLTVVMVKARNLKWSQRKQAGTCFVKVYLLQNGKKCGKKKTSTRKNESNPLFNEAMIFSVPSNALHTVQLRITVAEVMPDSKVSSIGHVIVGPQVSGTELTHWTQMMSSLRKPVAMWHHLQKH